MSNSNRRFVYNNYSFNSEYFYLYPIIVRSNIQEKVFSLNIFTGHLFSMTFFTRTAYSVVVRLTNTLRFNLNYLNNRHRNYNCYWKKKYCLKRVDCLTFEIFFYNHLSLIPPLCTINARDSSEIRTHLLRVGRRRSYY